MEPKKIPLAAVSNKVATWLPRSRSLLIEEDEDDTSSSCMPLGGGWCRTTCKLFGSNRSSSSHNLHPSVRLSGLSLTRFRANIFESHTVGTKILCHELDLKVKWIEWRCNIVTIKWKGMTNGYYHLLRIFHASNIWYPVAYMWID